MPPPHLPVLALLVLLGTAPLLPRGLAQTQQEMNHQAAGEFQRADAELNAVYRKLLATLPDDEAKAKLTRAQRAWVAFRDAQAAFDADEMRGGTAEPLLRSGALARLTRERAKALRETIAARDR